MNIVDLLRLDFLSLPQRVRLVTALSAGPWCWPCKPADEVAAVSHGGPRPPLPVGGCLLVTDGEDASSLWVENVPRGVRAVERPLGTVAQQAWREATTAAHRALPYLTGLPRGWDDMPRVLHRIAYHAKDHRRATLPPSLDGPSFGLAFLLGRASYLMEHPVPANVVACATVAEDGRLGLVDGLDGKLGVISNWARQVRTVLVAKRQVDLWRDRAQALGLAMDFRGFDKASQAVEWVFAAAIRRRFEDTPRDTREAHAEHLFRLALRRRDDVVDWLPVAAAASTMREVWKPESDGNQAWRLRFAHAIAARHEGRAVELTLPPSSFFDTLVLPRQLVVAAHLVMHVADVGSPPAAEVERFVGPLLERADAGEG